jgi:hypothetical protein
VEHKTIKTKADEIADKSRVSEISNLKRRLTYGVVSKIAARLNLFLIPMIFFLTQSNLVLGQCIADAGPDITVCGDWSGIDTVQMGGNPTATGGVPPYTYIWETTWQVGSWTYTASDFLNDTTLANPSIIYPGEDLTFYLTVVDSESNICKDSVNVKSSIFGTHLMYVYYTIQQGDSIFLTGLDNVLGGIPPVKYLWRPNHGLTDSTSLSFWAKPDKYVAYYLTATDSAGCSATGAPVYFINVIPVSIEHHDVSENRSNVFPNPSGDRITISLDGGKIEMKVLEFYDSKGQLIFTKETKENTVQVKTELLAKGLNFYKITASGELIAQGKFIVK